MTAYLYRMPVGIAGAISRPQDLTTEPTPTVILFRSTMAIPPIR